MAGSRWIAVKVFVVFRPCELGVFLSLCLLRLHIFHYRSMYTHESHTDIRGQFSTSLTYFILIFLGISRPVVPCHTQALCCHWFHFHIDFMNVPYSFIHITQTLVSLSLSLTHIHTHIMQIVEFCIIKSNCALWFVSYTQSRNDERPSLCNF